MRGIFQIIPVLTTLLLLVLGANMPRLVSLVFDNQLEQEFVQREDTFAHLALAKERDFFQTLALFRSDHTQVMLSEGYQMTAGEVKSVAAEIVDNLSVSNLVHATPTVTPILFASQDANGATGVFWRCIFGELQGDYDDVKAVLWLDDQSGQMVAFFGKNKFSELIDSKTGSHEAAAAKMVEYCRNYYPVDSAELAWIAEDEKNRTLINIKEDNDKNVSEIAISEYASEIQYTITLYKEMDGQTETLTIPVRLWDNKLYFNS